MERNAAFRLDGKVALVTGAARGLGAEIARTFLQAGACVMLTDVDEAAGAAAQARLPQLQEAAPGRCAFLRLDVTDETAWETAVASTLERFGGLDVLVNNAGIETAAFLADCELAQFQRTLEVNVNGVFLGVKHAIRAMRPGGKGGKGGAIINLSSVAAMVGSPAFGAYSASKGAVRSLTKAAAVECARLGYGIRVNSLHPGVVKTELGTNVLRDIARLGMAASAAEAEALIGALHPLGYGEASDVAHAALYLASAAARWTTGAEMVIDGGVLAA